MSKTLTLGVLRTAQGVQAISGPTAGYTSTDFISGPDSFGNMTYPVVAQLAPPPDVMTSFIPTGENITIQATLSSSLSKSYELSIGDSYTTAEAREVLEKQFKAEFGIKAWPAAEKNDLANGFFSCKYNKNYGLYSLCPTPSVSNMQTYTKRVPYMFDLYGNPIAWMTIRYVSGTCSLSSGTYTMSENIGTSGRTDVNGMAFWEGKGNWTISAASPSLILTYNEGLIVAVTGSPSGYIDRTTPNVFSWHTTWTGFPVENVPQTSAKLQWKNGQSGTVNTINISGSSTTYTMAANTLPESSELYWRVQTTTASGTATSDWRAVRTVDTEGFCAGISPSGAYIDGTEETRFVWTYSTASGAAPSGYDLQIKGTADADFRTIASATTTDTFALIPAGTLPGGSLQWRVRGYNQSGLAGEWSEPLSCVVISAPAAPEVWIESASPRPTIAWSAVGQLAFEVRAGSYSSGTIFGTDKSFKIPAYLPDGQTAVQVRVLGEYDLWSPYGQTSLTVANAGSGEILLTAQAQSGDAALSWTVAENATGYQILRGGKLIAETTETAYLDPYSIGSVTYRVRAVLPGDDYILSNPASVQLSVPCPRIRALDSGWIELDTYTTPLPSLQITATRDVALMQYAGHDYPIPEVSRHRTRTWIANPAFSDHAKAAAFEQLLGRVVYVKDQYGTEMTGIMASIQRMPSRFYTELTAVVQEIGGFDV